MRMSFAIRRHGAIASLLCAVVFLVQPAAGLAQDLRSPALAKELSSVMTAAQLKVVALSDPDAPDRFIAVMVDEVQLLLVTARVSSPDYVKRQIDQKLYTEAYADLQQTDLPATRVFYQDLGADGLAPRGSESIDIVYSGKDQTLFGGDGKGGPSKEQYQQKLRETDAQYSRLLELTIAAVKKHLTDTVALVR